MADGEELTQIPTSMIVGKKKRWNGPTYLVCNHLAPLLYMDTEALMCKITQDNTISIYWHDGTMTPIQYTAQTRVETFARYYPIKSRQLMQLHERQRRTPSLVSNEHAVNVTNFHLKLGTELKNRIQANLSMIHHRRISKVQLKFADIVAKMDWLFYTLFYEPVDSSVPDNIDAFQAYILAAGERDKMLTTTTAENRAWTIFELRHQFRLTINDYFHSILYKQPLQSHFLFATTLLRLDNVLEGLMTGADKVE
jgi:hypothetical protein